MALGDALEKKNETMAAIYVYRDLTSLGINIQGLNEKLEMLEAINAQAEAKKEGE